MKPRAKGVRAKVVSCDRVEGARLDLLDGANFWTFVPGRVTAFGFRKGQTGTLRWHPDKPKRKETKR